MAYGDSAAASLAEVQAAIGRCLLAQSYGGRGNNKVMAELKELRALEKDLLAEIAADSASGRTCSLGTLMRPR